MSGTINYGGSAFPCGPTVFSTSGDDCSRPGMTLRDYFAAQIAAGDAAAGEGWEIGSNSNSIIRKNAIDSRARFYYEIADAMLRARELK